MSMSNLPAHNPSARASADDRIQVAQLLSEAASNGRLTLAQYEDRLAKTYAADTYDHLQRLTNDLPEAMEFRRGTSRPAPATRPRRPGSLRSGRRRGPPAPRPITS